MKLKTPKPHTNFWVIAATVAFFILAYIIYLQQYVPGRESKIISTRFRVLDQLGNNIHDKIESYDKNVLTLENKVLDTLNSINQLLGLLGHPFSMEEVVPVIYDGLTKGKYKEFLNKDLEVYDYKLDLGGDAKSVLPDYLKDNDLNSDETDKYYYFGPVAIKISSTVRNVSKTFCDSLLVRVKYEDILNGLTREDVFDGMFIIRNREFVFSTLPSDLVLQTMGSDKDFFGLFNFPEPAKSEDKKGVIKAGPELSLPDRLISGQFSEITISNQQYKLFFKPVKIENEYWFLGGLMEVSNFNITGRSIPQGVIIWLSLILILIFLGLPLIKIRIISKLEQLKAGIIINSTLAIVLGAAISTLFLLYLFQSSIRMRNADDRLENLSDEIVSSFTEEIKDAFDQIELMDGNFYEFGDAEYIPDILNLPEGSPARPDIYPFADYIFWVDENGVQSTMLSPFRKASDVKIDVKKRDYFTKKDEWFFPPDPDKKFRLESIISWRTGEHKVGLSTASKESNHPVIALTSRFYSLIDPIIPKNFGYCIIDEEGKVWFHSHKYRNLMENFIEECDDNPTLSAAMYNRSSTSVNVTYYNKPHRVHITPLSQLPLFLITFYNRETETSFHSQVFTMALVFISLFLIFLILQVSLLLILERINKGKLTKNLIMDLARPKYHRRGHYLFLFRAYLSVAIAMTIGLPFLGKTDSFIALFIIEVIMFLFTYLVINENGLRTARANWFTGINLTWLLLLNIALFILSNPFIALIILGFELLLTYWLYKLYHLFKLNNARDQNAGHDRFVSGYMKFLMGLLVILIILPTMVFYEIAYNKESEIRLRHYQADMMKKRESRNKIWNQYYATIVDPTDPASVLQERKDRGIYSEFLQGLSFTCPTRLSMDKQIKQDRDSWLNPIILRLRPYYDTEINENKLLINDDQNINPNHWIYYGRDSLGYSYLSNTEDPGYKSQKTMCISGRIEKFNFLLPYNDPSLSAGQKILFNGAFWAFMSVIFIMMYFLVRFGVRNIFGLDLVKKYVDEPFGQKMKDLLLAHDCIFLVNPGSDADGGRYAGLLKPAFEFNWSVEADRNECISRFGNPLTEAGSPKEPAGDDQPETRKILMICGFDQDYLKPGIFKEKLDLLTELLRKNDLKLVIILNHNMDKMITDYQEFIDVNKNIPKDDKNTERVDLTPYLKNLKDLRSLSSSSVSFSAPVRTTISDDSTYDSIEDPDIRNVVSQELKACDYLQQFKESVLSFYDSTIRDQTIEKPEEVITDRIMTLASGYYEDLFNACAPEEQFVLFDMADDLALNQKNSKFIFSLLDKGILIRKKDGIRFMNESFRKFLLAAQTTSATAALEAKIGKKAGTWQGYRIVFLLIIVSLFIFISMANQDFIKHLQQVFVVIGGGIAAVTGVLGLLSKTGKPSA
jgi:hypothetical protein